jgi:hypothetical protein
MWSRVTKWFTAIFMMSCDKRGISAKKPASDIGVSYPAAWLMLHKIRKAMSERESGCMLTKIIEMDDAYFGVPDEGRKRGRGTDKTPAVIAVQVDEKGRPVYAKAAVVDNLQGTTIIDTARMIAEPGSEIRTDGYKSYGALSGVGYEVNSKNFDPQDSPDHLLWPHKVISNIKAFIAGTYHGLDKKHLQLICSSGLPRRGFQESALFRANIFRLTSFGVPVYLSINSTLTGRFDNG